PARAGRGAGSARARRGVARTTGRRRRAGRSHAVSRARSPTLAKPIMWLIRAALRRPITIVVAVLAVALTAVFAVSRMRIDIFPDLNLPAISVAQPYGGMSPAQLGGYIPYYYTYHIPYTHATERLQST